MNNVAARSDALVGVTRDPDLRHASCISALADDLERIGESGEGLVDVFNPLVHGAEERLVHAHAGFAFIHQSAEAPERWSARE